MILVTGGAGFVGSHTIKKLAEWGCDTVAFDNLSEGHREHVLWGKFFKADLLDIEALREVFNSYPIEAVMHFAALTRVGESVENPQKYYVNNVVGGLNLLHVMIEYSVKDLIFSSSAAIYGNPMEIPISEDHFKKPVSPYGRTKWIFERTLEEYAQAYGIRYVSLRYFNAAGSDLNGAIGEWHDPETHLIPTILEAAAGKRPYIKIFGTDYQTPDGTCIRDFVHVTDLAEAHVLAFEYLKDGGANAALNLGTGKGYSVREVIENCRRITGEKIDVLEGPRRQGDPPRLVADPSQANQALSWIPKYSSLPLIVDTAWRWLKRRS